MKNKLIILLPLFLIITTSSYTQKLDFNFGVGYGLASGSQIISTNGSLYYYNGTKTAGQEEYVKGSFAKGKNINAGFRYMFNEFIGLDINFSYTIGAPIKSSRTETYQDSSSAKTAYGTPTTKITEQSKGDMFLFAPAIVISTNFKSVCPYAKFGPVVGVVSVKYNGTGQTTFSNTSALITNSIYEKYSGGVPFGMAGTLGINIFINQYLRIYTEAYLKSINYSPGKLDHHSSSEQKDKEYSFSKSGSLNSNVLPRPVLPFSSIGLNFGVRITR